MDDIVGNAGRGLLWLVRWLFIEIFIEFFLRGLGYLTLKVVTFGKHPQSLQEREQLSIGIGGLVVVIAIAWIALLNTP